MKQSNELKKFSTSMTKIELQKIKGGLATSFTTNGCYWTQIPGGVTSDDAPDKFPDDVE